MNRNDIDRLFTQKVAEHLAEGFQISATSGSMRGSQGEIAKVDLIKGNEFRRIWMDLTTFSWSDAYNGFVTITVARCAADEIRQTQRHFDATVWTDRLEVCSEIKLARVTDDYFVSPEEGAAMAAKRNQRIYNRQEHPYYRPMGEAAKEIALRWVRKQPRMKSCRLEDITSVRRVNRRDWGNATPELAGYEIEAKGKTYTLRAPKPA